MSAVKKLWDYINGINGLLFILYSIFVFSTAVIVSERFTKGYFAIALVFIIVLSVLICPVLLRFFSKRQIPRAKDQRKPGSRKSKVITYLVFFLIPMVIFLLCYFAYYPGGFSLDSINQYTQAVTNQYNDWHPVIQTLFAIKLPLLLTGGWVGSIALFQSLCFSAVLSYSFNAILEYTNMKYTLIAMAFVLLNPQLGFYVMYPWKDVSFMIGAVLLMAYSLKIFVTKGQWLKSPLNMAVFIVTAALTTLFRHNALLFTVPLVIAVLFYTTRLRGLILCLCVIVLCLGIKYPLYSALGVEKPDKRQVETLGLPMNVIGAVTTYDPEDLDEETKEFAYQLAPEEVWEEKYTYGTFNNVKWDVRTDNDVIEEYGRNSVISMMLKCLKNSTRVSLTSLIKLTEPVFTVSDKYYSIRRPYISEISEDENPIILTGMTESAFHYEQKGNALLQEILTDYSDFAANAFPHVFMYLGVMSLLLIMSVLAKCRLNRFRDWKKIFFILPVFIYNFGSSLLLTDINDAWRLFLYTFVLVPTLLVFLYGKEEERGMDIKVQQAI